MERVASRCVVRLLAQRSAFRRGYSVAAAAMAKGGEEKTAVAAKRAMAEPKKDAAAAAVEEKTAWVPDPLTGYYRPSGGAKQQVDAAELRAKLCC